MKVTTNVGAEAVNQNAERRLYVEGSHPDGLDPTVLRALVEHIGLRVEPLGPSQHIRAVARAMHASHPRYFFIIDRDFHDHAFVERSWTDFADPDRQNLLIWRRRELENYFIEPALLQHSGFLRPDWDLARLQRRVRELVQARIFMDCANLTIAGAREGQKRTWIDFFDDARAMPSADAGRAALLGRSEWASRTVDVQGSVAGARLAEAYDEFVHDALGGSNGVEHGTGRWLSVVSGAEVFRSIANEAFAVHDGSGTGLQGKPARSLLARDLLKRERNLPADLVAAAELLTRVAGVP